MSSFKLQMIVESNIFVVFCLPEIYEYSFNSLKINFNYLYLLLMLYKKTLINFPLKISYHKLLIEINNHQ